MLSLVLNATLGEWQQQIWAHSEESNEDQEVSGNLGGPEDASLRKKSLKWHTTLELDWLYTAPGRQRQMGARSEFYERNNFSNNDKMGCCERSFAP